MSDHLPSSLNNAKWTHWYIKGKTEDMDLEDTEGELGNAGGGKWWAYMIRVQCVNI